MTDKSSPLIVRAGKDGLTLIVNNKWLALAVILTGAGLTYVVVG